MVSSNYKISDITAAVGLAQLKAFDTEVAMRQQRGAYYDKLVVEVLQGQATPANLIPDYTTNYNWQNYHVLLNSRFDRDQVVDLLRKQGIGCKWDIQAIHLEPVFEGRFNNITNDMPNTMRFHNHGLWIPFYAELTEDDQEYVINTLHNILNILG